MTQAFPSGAEDGGTSRVCVRGPRCRKHRAAPPGVCPWSRQACVGLWAAEQVSPELCVCRSGSEQVWAAGRGRTPTQKG